MPKKSELVRKARKAKTIRQIAAVPCRVNERGVPEVMLVTSRTTERFIVPKGWPMKGKSARKVAATEARQEAGVVGKALREPIGRYSYWKRLSDCFVPVEVTVYLLAVSAVRDKWEEQSARRRAWLTAEDAVALIDEPQLAAIIGGTELATMLSATKTKERRRSAEPA